MVRHFTKLLDLSLDEARTILRRAKELKDARKKGISVRTLENKVLAMIFEKASTRTRISFEVGIKELGGDAVVMNTQDMQLSRGETIKDTARVLSRYVHGVMVRTFKQETVEELAKWSDIPVINGLSDKYHPCQILSDVFTIEEFKGPVDTLKVAYVGDGNNVANSLIEASILFNFPLTISCPSGFEPDHHLAEEAKKRGTLKIYRDPKEGVYGADVIYTDVWVSMGQEREESERKRIFKDYSITNTLLLKAKDNCIVLHCLPAHKGEEIEEEVFERFGEVIFTQAENRLHVQKSLLEWLMS